MVEDKIVKLLIEVGVNNIEKVITWVLFIKIGDTNNNRNGIDINKKTNVKKLKGEFTRKIPNFWSFRPKLDLINWLIWYKANFLFFLYTIISVFIYFINSFFGNSLYSNLIIVNFCCFSIYISNFTNNLEVCIYNDC